MKPERREIEVWADWDGLAATRVGVLSATPTRGKEVFAFTYETAWLAHQDRPSLDPVLALYRGPQYPSDTRDNFGAFLDSAPDRWGRVLMRRWEAQRAREEGRKPRTLLESDYLLGVFDGHRSGGLRYRLGPDGPFLDDDAELASPPWTSLRKLEQISRALEQDGVEDDPSYGRWLKMLLAPGRSLGGARPKASVRAPTGELWIAKFPSRDDPHDIGAWEWVTHALATRAGIVTAPSRCQRFRARGHHTFLTQRFDRQGEQRRHFASAMTLLEKQDGEQGSYLELAEAIAQRGLHPARDLEQLWRRICFFVCVSNLDDHLRNHGFLLEGARGWSLAPAYDMNPDPLGAGLTLDISESDNAQDLDLVRSVAPHFRVKPERVDTVIAEVVTAVRTWRELATSLGLSRAEHDRMGRAFRVADDA